MCTSMISSNAIKHNNVRKLKIKPDISKRKEAKTVIIHRDDFRRHNERSVGNVHNKHIFRQIKPPELRMAG